MQSAQRALLLGRLARHIETFGAVGMGISDERIIAALLNAVGLGIFEM
jgi:hypothetical protein